MISYNYSTKVITVDATTSLRVVYSDAMRIFAQSAQMDDLIPFYGNTPTLITLMNGWTFSLDSIQYLTSAALQDSTGDNIWTNIQTLGTLAAGTTLYIKQNGAVAWTAPTTGHINMLLKTKNNGTEIDSQNFTVYARKFQNEYSSFSTTGGAIVAPCPLSTKADSNLTIDETTIQGYTGLSITWGAVSKDAQDGLGSQPYSVVIDCNGKTLKEAYNWVQYQLLQNSDIDAGAGTKLGNITDPLLTMAGSTVITQTGVWIENFDGADANNVRYTDGNGVLHTPPQLINISVDAPSEMEGGQVIVLRLDSAYNPATYTPANVVATLIDDTLDASGNKSVAITYEGDWYARVVTRKPGYKPFDVGTIITSTGMAITTVNEADPVYVGE